MSILLPNAPERVLLHRELRSIFHLARYFILAAVFTGIAVAFSIFQLRFAAYMPIAEVSRMLTTDYFYAIVLSAFVILPPVSATAIRAERARNCLDLLLSAPFSARDIFYGKFYAILVFFLFALVATLPVLGVVFFQVGIDWKQLASGLTGCLVIAISCTAIGLYAGVRAASINAAVLNAYTLVFLLVVLLPLIPCGLFSTIFFFNTGSIFTTLTSISCLLYTVFLLRFLRIRAESHLRNGPLPDKQVDAGVLVAESFGMRLVPKRALENPAWRPRGRQFGALVKGNRADQFRYLLASLALMGIPLMITAQSLEVSLEALLKGWTGFFGVAFFLLLPESIATRVSGEYEGGTMEQLRMTLIRPREMVVGNLVVALLANLPMLCVLPCSLLTFCLVRDSDSVGLWPIFSAHLGLLLFAVLCLVTSHFAALWFRSDIRAILAAYVSALALAWLCLPVRALQLPHLLAMVAAAAALLALSIPLMRWRHYSNAERADA